MAKSQSRLPRVALVGEEKPGGMTTSVARGFSAAGFDPCVVPYADWRPSVFHPHVCGSGLASRVLQAALLPVAEVRLVRELQRIKPDLVLIIKCDDLQRWVYRAIRRIGETSIFAFHPDDPTNISRRLRSGPSHRRAMIQMREADRFMIWSRALATRFEQAGIHALYFPFAADPELHHPVELSSKDREEFGAQVCFVGNWDPERERWLSKLEAGELALWGAAYWAVRCQNARLRRAWRGRELFGNEMCKAVNASSINLNILRSQNKEAVNMRSFEILACGGFMLHERSKDLSLLLRRGVEYDDFGTPEELNQKVRYYLDHDIERKRIAEAGCRVAVEHVYRKWAERVVEAWRELQGQRGAWGTAPPIRTGPRA